MENSEKKKKERKHFVPAVFRSVYTKYGFKVLYILVYIRLNSLVAKPTMKLALGTWDLFTTDWYFD